MTPKEKEIPMKTPTEKVDTIRKQILMKAHVHEGIVTEEMAEEHYKSCLYCQTKMQEYADNVAME